MIKNKNTILIILAAILALALVAVLVFTGVFSKWKTEKSYSMIYLSNGEIYIGKLSNMMSDRMVLTDSYLLNTVKDANDETKTSFQLAPLKDNIISSEKLYFNKDQVVFYGPVNPDSKVGEALVSQK